MPKNLSPAAQLKAQGHIADEIVTGEAVVLELPAATAFSRIVAGGIDVLFYMLLLAGTLYFVRVIEINFSSALFQAYIIFSLAFYIWLLPACVTLCTRGSSLGKLILRIRLVRLDGGAISARQSFIRSLIAIFEVWVGMGVPAAVTIFISRRAQRVGDLVAGTYVVRWPKRKFTAPDLEFPAQLRQWGQTAQTRALTIGLHLNIVNHFKTAKQLTTAARTAQAQVLAAAAEKYVAPPVPWGTPPEDFLAALLLQRFAVESENSARQVRHQQQMLQRIQELKF